MSVQASYTLAFRSFCKQFYCSAYWLRFNFDRLIETWHFFLLELSYLKMRDTDKIHQAFLSFLDKWAFNFSSLYVWQALWSFYLAITQNIVRITCCLLKSINYLLLGVLEPFTENPR